jgi:hypothetical protein
MSEQRLEDDRDDRNAEGGANPLGDPGVHRGVGDGRRRDVLIGDRHGRNENGTVTAAASTKLATVTRRAPRRADLLALLTSMSRARATFTAVAAAAAFSGLLVDTGLTPAQARDKILGDQPLWRDQAIYRRAHDRGELDLERIPPGVLAMPFDLVRHDLLMNLKPLQPARIKSIIDELFLPLVQSHQSGADPTGTT